MLASKMEFRFLRPVYIGETVGCEIKIETIDDRNSARAGAVFTNQERIGVLCAILIGYRSGKREREILSAMAYNGDPANRLC